MYGGFRSQHTKMEVKIKILSYNHFYHETHPSPFLSGGAFLIPYLIVLILIGRPLYFMELAIGQFSSRSSVKVWDVVPAARGRTCIFCNLL